MRRGAIGILLAAALAAPADDVRRVEQALQAVIAKAEPAVACLYVSRPDRAPVIRRPNRRPTEPEDRETVPDFYATGVVVESSGKILTNYHVLREAAGGGDPSRVGIRVRLPRPDGPPREGPATVFAADARSDLAVLKVELGTLPTIPIGRGEDLKKGSLVVALGHPYAAGFRDGSPSASWGIVSNLRRRGPAVSSETEYGKLSLSQFATLLQTDVRLQVGTSGGALLDMDGKLAGLTIATAALSGVDAPGGFAIPFDPAVRRIVGVLLRGEEVEYGFLGVSLDSRIRNSPTISNVVANSPAEAAGLLPGDVIVKVNDRLVRDQEDLFYALAVCLAGRPAELVIDHGAGPIPVRPVMVKAPIDLVGNRPAEMGVAKVRPPDVHGLRVEYTSVLRGELNIPRGVLVREAVGQAAARGLQPYVDVVTQVNDNDVNTPAEFYARAAEVLRRGDAVKLTIGSDPPRTVTLP